MTAEITRSEAAQLWDTDPDTFSSYVTRGQAPAPVRHVGRTPLWGRDQLVEAARNRPGRGRWKKPAPAQGD